MLHREFKDYWLNVVIGASELCITKPRNTDNVRVDRVLGRQ